jgi:hypothetical protein
VVFFPGQNLAESEPNKQTKNYAVIIDYCDRQKDDTHFEGTAIKSVSKTDRSLR